MKRFLLIAMIFTLGLLAYSCAATCTAVPPPGGFSYGQPAEKGK